MNILYLHQYFNTPSMPGSTRSYEFARRLVNRGDTVHMVTSNWQGWAPNNFSTERGISVYWLPVPYANRMSNIQKVFTFIKYIWYTLKLSSRLNFDLIVASSTPLSVAFPALWFKYKNKVQLVFEVRDLWPQLPIAVGAIKSPPLIWLACKFEKMVYQASQQVVLLSEGMHAELLKNGVPNKKLSTITNLSDVKHFNVASEEGQKFRQKFSWLNDRPLVVYTGAFGRINGLSYLVKMALEMKKFNQDVRFLLAGDGYEVDQLSHLAEKYGILNQTLFFINYLPKDQMPGLLSAATVTTSFFVDFPEMQNNSANKFFDALAAGKPIMINYGGWQADLLRETKAGLVVPADDPHIAAKQLNALIADQGALRKMGTASKHLACRFDVETCFKLFAKTIDTAYDIHQSNTS